MRSPAADVAEFLLLISQWLARDLFRTG